MIRDLFFIGYEKGKYGFLTESQLRGARSAFKSQIKFATAYSLILAAVELAGILCVMVMSTVGDFEKNTELQIEIAVTLVVPVLAVLSVRSKIATAVLTAVYLLASVLLFIYGNELSLLACIVGALIYFKLIFAHIHLGYIEKQGNIDDFSDIIEIIDGTGETREELKAVYEKYRNGGENPLTKQSGYENIFELDIEELKPEEEKDIQSVTSLSEDRIDAVLDKMAQESQEDDPDWL